jgi:hypothetical protein
MFCPPRSAAQTGPGPPWFGSWPSGLTGGGIADLAPVLSGDVDRLDRQNDADMIFDDVAVLEPVRFADAEQERA